mmetsp:Transcript_8645/g.17534  ORF Transcript_8645/g.17534 Transcript_8645/m.17534 type:complete len:129 (+) Transcript_8645:228-614(+)
MHPTIVQDFLPLPIKPPPVVPLRTTAEARYWSSFRPRPIVSIGTSPVTDVDFALVEPFELAAAAGSKVLILDGRGQTKKTIARFKDAAYGVCFKKDGKLLAAGGENGLVQVFDRNSRAILRTFRGHSG